MDCRKALFDKIVGSLLLGLAFLGTGALADGVEQIVSVAADEVAVGPEATNVFFDVTYTTDPVGELATGLDIQMFYDSAVIAFERVSKAKVEASKLVVDTQYTIRKEGNTDWTAVGAADNEKDTVFTATGQGEGTGTADEVCFEESLTCLNSEVSGFLIGIQDKEDSSNEDGDASTDRYVLVAYAATGADQFPGEDTEFPVKLLSQNFKKVDSAFEGATKITFVAGPASGNTAKVPQNFSVRFKGDEIKPTITLAESSVTIEAQDQLTDEDNSQELTDYIATITVEDNKDDLTTDDIEVSLITKDGEEVADDNGFAPGTYEVTLVVKDSSQNESDPVVLTLTVVDTTAPLLSGVSDVTLAALNAEGIVSAGQLAISADDLVDGPIEFILTVDGETPSSYPLGETVVTVTATDKSGNTSTETLTVTVTDQTPPVISSSLVTLEANGEVGFAGTAGIIAAITVLDNVDLAPAVTIVGKDVLSFVDTSVTVVAEDAAGNKTEGVVPVTVVDTTAPEFSGANQLILTVDAEDEVVAATDKRVTDWLTGVTATDLVDGDVEVTNSALPAQFAFGEEEITFTATDARNNTATKVVTVLVAVGPSVTVPDPILVVSLDGEPLPVSQTQIAAFIAEATAQDFSGSALEVSNDAPDPFPLGETVVTFTAVDAEAREGQNISSVTVIAPSAENDTDKDGMDDQFEVDNQLDPNVDDADEDADGDGRSNLDEYLEGKDPNADDVPPVVTAPSDVQANATGRLTKVALGEATAVDALDGDLVPVADRLAFLPGASVVTWTATDAAGNEGSATQNVVVSPQVSTRPKDRAAEGGTYDFTVVLNGPAPAYPVVVPVTLGGTAELDSDYTVDADSITIASGRKGVMSITVLADDAEEGEETIEISLGAPEEYAVLGATILSTISIIESDVPPALKLAVSQGEQKGRKVSASGGAVSVALSISDVNGTHTVDWSSSDNNLVATSEDGSLTFEFDPSALAEGGYEVTAIVTDSAIADQTFTIGTLVRVSAEETVEADSDGDGVPDSKDLSEETNVIAINADAGDVAVSADEGVKLVIGDAAQASGTAGIGITEDTIAASGQDGGEAPTNGTDEDFDYPAGLYDFQVQDLPVPGQSVRLVIPVASGVPAGAVFRKYTEDAGWFDFVIDDNNAVATAPGSDGACPSVGSDAFVAGLTEGDTCLQITVQDGGPNDADGQTNGEYDDPSGIAEAVPVVVVEVPDVSSQRKVGGGGCSVSEGPGDFGLLFLALLGALGLLRKRFMTSIVNR